MAPMAYHLSDNLTLFYKLAVRVIYQVYFNEIWNPTKTVYSPQDVKMRNILAAACISGFLLSGCASGGFGKSQVNITEAKILQSGMYEGSFLKHKKTVGGGKQIKWMEDVEFVNDSDNVPAKNGNKFGFKLVIRGEPDGEEIKILVLRHHPPMKNPKRGKTTSLSKYSRVFKLNSPQGIGFGFDHDWELVEGQHKFEIYYDDQKLIEKSFTVYKP